MGNGLSRANVPEDGQARPPLPQRVPQRARETVDGSPPSRLAAGLQPPRLFALVSAPFETGDLQDDLTPEERASPGLDEPGAPGRVFAWGMEFTDEAVVHLCKHGDAHRELGVFQSAESACALFSLLDDLRLIYVSVARKP